MEKEYEGIDAYADSDTSEMNQLIQLIKIGDQEIIIDFLGIHAEFRQKYVLNILQLIEKGTLKKVVEYLMEQYEIDKGSSPTKRLIIRDNTEPTVQLKNYKNDADLENRHLQSQLRANSDGTYTKEIIQFIKNADIKELNAAETDGTTALQTAEVQFYHAKKNGSKHAESYSSIINALMERGVEGCSNRDKEALTPTDLLAIKFNDTNTITDNSEESPQIETSSISTTRHRAHRSPKSLDKSAESSHPSFRLTALSIGIAAVLYVSYKTFNNRNIQKAVKAK